jgi:hypothetical protein
MDVATDTTFFIQSCRFDIDLKISEHAGTVSVFIGRASLVSPVMKLNGIIAQSYNCLLSRNAKRKHKNVVCEWLLECMLGSHAGEREKNGNK